MNNSLLLKKFLNGCCLVPGVRPSYILAYSMNNDTDMLYSALLIKKILFLNLERGMADSKGPTDWERIRRRRPNIRLSPVLGRPPVARRCFRRKLGRPVPSTQRKRIDKF